MKFNFIFPTFPWIIIALVMFLITGGVTAMGQRYQTTTYTEADGLANSMVFDMVQDSSGVLWIGRRAGISSYDGTGFFNYGVNDGLRSSSYTFLTIDEKENLWALPDAGALFFSRLEGTKWHNISANGQLPGDFKATYTSLVVFYDKGEPTVLAGTHDMGLIYYREKHWRRFTTADGLPSNMVNSVREINGTIYIASDKGLILLRNGVLNPVHDAGSSLLSGNIIALARDGKTLWLLGEGWLGYLSDGKFRMATMDFHFPENEMVPQCFLYPGKNGKIYFGNILKLFCYTPATNRVEMLNRTIGMISEGATSVLVDREMNTWITGLRGITKIPSERFASFAETEGLVSNEVASGIELSPGRYVFGHEGALTFYDGKTMTPFFLDPGRLHANYESRILDMKHDAKGDLWLAASSLGVARLDKNKHVTWYRDRQGVPGAAFSIAVTSSGSLYAGTTYGLYEFTNGRFRQVDLGNIYNHAIRKIIPGTNDTLYLATLSSGLIMMKGGVITDYSSADNPMANNVYAFFTDSKQHQWVGTAAGLYELAGHKLKRVNRDGLMISKPVFLILEDHEGNLWTGTDNGVYRWNGEKLDHFTVNDGLSGQEINRAAGFVDNYHHIWFGTNNGLTVFSPELDYKPGQVPPPKVRLLQVGVGTDSLYPRKGRDFPDNFNDLSFHVRVISLINERQVFVKYFLEGSDRGWSNELPYIGSRFIYNNLSPGSYRFFLKARNALGTWSDPVISAKITIRPPFWLRWWFLLLLLLLFSGIIIITARMILVSRYKNQLKEEINLRTKELRKSEMQLIESNAAKDSFFAIIAHDLRNPFNSILGFLELLTGDEPTYSEADRKKMLLQLKSASVRTNDLLENLLTWARAQRGSLPFEPVTFPLREVIADNLDLFGTAAQTKNISFINNSKQDILVFADRNMISTVIRNLVSNALKFTYPGGTIVIGMELQDPETILISVKDSGIGMTPAFRENLFKIEHRTVVHGTANETGTGLGLILCKEFIVKNGGTIRVSSIPGTGSTFFLTLPAASTTEFPVK